MTGKNSKAGNETPVYHPGLTTSGSHWCCWSSGCLPKCFINQHPVSKTPSPLLPLTGKGHCWTHVTDAVGFNSCCWLLGENLILDHGRITDGDLPSLHQVGLGISPVYWNLPCSDGLDWLLCGPLPINLTRRRHATKDGWSASR